MGPEQDMSGHDMSSHAGHDMSSHAGHGQPAALDGHQGHGMHGAASEAGEEGSHYVFMSGHGDGLLQAGVSEVLLFAGAVTSNAASLALACFVLILVAVMLEYLRLLAWWLESRFVKCSGERRDEGGVPTTICNGTTKQNNVTSAACPTSMLLKTDHTRYDSVDGADRPPGGSTAASKPISSSVWVAALGLLNVVIYVVGTCLMLITMTFNIYIIVAIGVGFSLGKIATMFTKVRLLSTAKAA